MAQPSPVSVSGADLLRAFLSGAGAALIFHQLGLGLLHLVGITPLVPYSLAPVPPFGVPQVLSLAFWGGLWALSSPS